MTQNITGSNLRAFFKTKKTKTETFVTSVVYRVQSLMTKKISKCFSCVSLWTQ